MHEGIDENMEDPLEDLLIHSGNEDQGLLERISNMNAAEYSPITSQQMLDAIEVSFTNSPGISSPIQGTLVVGGPKDGEIVAANSAYMDCMLYDNDSIRIPKIEQKHYKEKTLVIDSDGNKLWLGWESEPDLEGVDDFLSTKTFKYKRIKISENHNGVIKDCVLFVPEDIPVENEEVGVLDIIEMTNSDLSEYQIRERFTVPPDSYRVYFDPAVDRHEIEEEYPETPDTFDSDSGELTTQEIQEAAELYNNINT